MANSIKISGQIIKLGSPQPQMDGVALPGKLPPPGISLMQFGYFKDRCLPCPIRPWRFWTEAGRVMGGGAFGRAEPLLGKPEFGIKGFLKTGF